MSRIENNRYFVSRSLLINYKVNAKLLNQKLVLLLAGLQSCVHH